MAVYLTTKKPSELLSSFKKAIDDKKILTWSYDKDGDFTHTADQWEKKAWFKPKVEIDQLSFSIVNQKNINLSQEVYAIYHGRLIECMLAHFDNSFTNGVATALPTTSDIVK